MPMRQSLYPQNTPNYCATFTGVDDSITKKRFVKGISTTKTKDTGATAKKKTHKQWARHNIRTLTRGTQGRASKSSRLRARFTYL